MTDGTGLPVAFLLRPGKRNGVPVFEPLMTDVRLPDPRGRPGSPRQLGCRQGLQLPPRFLDDIGDEQIAGLLVEGEGVGMGLMVV